MSQLHGDNYSSKGRVTIKRLLSLTLIGLIVVGFTIAANKSSIIDNVFTTEQAKKKAGIRKGPPITGTRG